MWYADLVPTYWRPVIPRSCFQTESLQNVECSNMLICSEMCTLQCSCTGDRWRQVFTSFESLLQCSRRENACWSTNCMFEDWPYFLLVPLVRSWYSVCCRVCRWRVSRQQAKENCKSFATHLSFSTILIVKTPDFFVFLYSISPYPFWIWMSISMVQDVWNIKLTLRSPALEL